MVLPDPSEGWKRGETLQSKELYRSSNTQDQRWKKSLTWHIGGAQVLDIRRDEIL